VSTSDAEAREAAWLAQVDALPSLLAVNGGPFEVVQAFWPGAKFAAKKTAIYVQRRRTRVYRFGGQRIRPAYEFQLKLVWPLKSTAAGIAEAEAQNFANAVELLRQRVSGFPGDKTHGGRFLSVAESLEGGSTGSGSYAYFEVDYLDPEVTIPQGGWLRALAAYPADDPELMG
jgi:hypothetical protein